MKIKQLKWIFFLVYLVIIPNQILAGSHPLTKHETVSSTGFFDLVVSLDWNPTQTEKDGKLKTAFEQFAKDTYMMSEGKNKIRNIYVFTNSAQMNKADIRLLNKGGRSNANASGFNQAGGRILTFTSYSGGAARTDSYIGHTIAHEFGHYGFGIYDEYADSGKSTSTYPIVPLSGDTPRDTIMNAQGSYQWLSTATDYSDTKNRLTAQWRVFSSSAWETLVRDPKDDKVPEGFTANYSRVRYTEFAGMTSPTSLTKPTTGWDSNFKITYMGGNVAVLIIDRTASMGAGSPSGLDSAKSAAKQFIDLMNIGDSVAVVAFDTSASTIVGVTQLTNQAAKNTAKSQIDTITSSGNTDFSAGLNQAWSVLNIPALSGNTRYAVFLSDGGCNTGTCPPSVSNFSANSIPIYAIGLGSSVDMTMLSNMAIGTGGQYYSAATGADLANLYASVNRQVNGLDNLMNEASGTIAAGQKSELQTTMSGRESQATFRTSWSTSDSITYQLVNPQGTTISSSNLPQGVTYQSGGTYGIYIVTNPTSGVWTSRAINTGSTASNTISQQVSSQSLLNIDIKVTGGTYPEPLGIMVVLTGPEPVVDATVVASIVTPAGAVAIPDIQLKDDGNAPDLMANDGVYSGVLANYTVNGSYTIKVKATNPSGTAYLSTAGALESGSNAASQSLQPFQRIASATITTSGYISMPSTTDAAILIPTDNTKKWGAIQSNDAAVWYKFQTISGTKYYIQTSSLVSTDATTMATSLTLYKSDTSKSIASSSHYNGSNISYIEWTAPTSETYYLKVEHGSPGTGTFALTVGQASIYQGTTTTSNSGGSSGNSGNSGSTIGGDGDSGGGCFIDTATY